MDTDGTHDARNTRPTPPPRPPAPPQVPPAAARGTPADAAGRAPRAPGWRRPRRRTAGARPSFVAWLRAPRAEAAGPGVWTFGHRPSRRRIRSGSPGGSCSSGALIAALCGLAGLVAALERLPRRLLAVAARPVHARTPGERGGDRTQAGRSAYGYYDLCRSRSWPSSSAASAAGASLAPLRHPPLPARRDEPDAAAAPSVPRTIPPSGRICGPPGRTARLIGWRPRRGAGR